MTWVAVLLALSGAVFFAFGARLQHQAVRATDNAPRVRSLLRRPGWVAGLALFCLGGGVHAVALGLAPLSVVQPIGVLAVGITALLGGRRRELPAVAMTMAGVGAFVFLAAGSSTPVPVTPRAALFSGLVVLGLLTIPVLAALLSTRPPIRALGFGAAGGTAFGYLSVLMRAVSQDILQGTADWLTACYAAGIVVALLAGGWLIQHAYASGPPHLTVACLTVADPLVAVGISAGLLGEFRHTNALTALAELACAALAIRGVIALARQPAPSAPHPIGAPVNRTRTLRIVIAAETFPPDVNGAAHFAQRLATGLAGRDHDVHVVTTDPEGRGRTDHVDGVTIHRLRSHRTPFHPTFRVGFPWQVNKDVKALLTDLDPDLVHVQAHFVIGRYVLRHASARDIPAVATNHFMPENLLGHARVPAWLHNAVSRWAWRDLTKVFAAADVVTAPTPRAVRLLHDQGFPPRAIAVSCGIDVDRYYPRDQTERTAAPTVLFVGRLDEEKRVDELLNAVALVPGLHAEIVGDGSCRTAWERLTDRLGISDRVRFRGFVSDAELREAYAAADVFCMPGIAELQSLATMEAMAAGKPVVLADAMALPHLCQPGRNGWLFTPGDVHGLADRLHVIATQPAVAARMGAASRELIGAHALDGTLETFESLYARALREADPARTAACAS